MNQPPLTPARRVGPSRSVADEARLALETFDNLKPGEVFALVSNQRPKALLERFQSDRKGQFEWTPTEEGPKVFRVEISRRAAALGATRAVNEALSWDHDRLDELEARAFAARATGDLALAKEVYSAFAFGLRRHIRFEEEILFPEFENRTGFPSHMGPTAVMRDEHREILSCLERIEAGIGVAGSNVDSPRHALHAVLGNHNLKEENIVYPGTDHALTPAERDDLVARIQAC